MKNILFLLLIISGAASAQSTRLLVTDKLTINDTIKLKTARIGEISSDTSLSNSDLKLSTSKAIRAYVNNRAGVKPLFDTTLRVLTLLSPNGSVESVFIPRGGNRGGTGGPEEDPTVSAFVKNITAASFANGNTAYSWGNHAGLYRPISYVPTWSEITGKTAFTLEQVLTAGSVGTKDIHTSGYIYAANGFQTNGGTTLLFGKTFIQGDTTLVEKSLIGELTLLKNYPNRNEYLKLRTDYLTGQRNQFFQDKDGTVALLSDLNGYIRDLPIATPTLLGAIKIGSGFYYANDGTLSSRYEIRLNGQNPTYGGTRMNFIAGTNMSLGINNTSDDINVTFNSTGGSGGVTPEQLHDTANVVRSEMPTSLDLYKDTFLLRGSFTQAAPLGIDSTALEQFVARHPYPFSVNTVGDQLIGGLKTFSTQVSWRYPGAGGQSNNPTQTLGTLGYTGYGVNEYFGAIWLGNTLNTNISTLYTLPLTNYRFHALPNKSGTIALLDDISSSNTNYNGDSVSVATPSAPVAVPSTRFINSFYATKLDVFGKVDKVTGKGLSTEDYTTAEKTKLAALPDQGEEFAGVNTNYLQKGLAAMGNTTKAITLGIEYSPGAMYGRDMYAGNIYLAAIYLDSAQTITGAKAVLWTSGNYTASGYNGVALYSVSGTTLTLVASSTNDGAIWTAPSGSMVTKAFSTPYVAAKGIYYVGFQYNDNFSPTTRPQFTNVTGAASSLFNTNGFTNSKFISGNWGSAGTTVPATITTTAVSVSESNPIWAAIY